MNRVEYMRELESLLYDIPAEEREDAINYYNDYFDAGGEENEERTIISLGTPEELARTIKLANGGSTVIDGEFTETGYYDGINADKQEIDKYAKPGTAKEIEKEGKSKLSGGMIALIVILAIFACPILIPLCFGGIALIFGIGLGMLAIVFSIIIAVIAAGFGGLFFAGVGLFTGVVGFFSSPMGALVVIGAALVALGFGLLLILGCIWLARLIIPPVFRAVISLFSKPVNWVKGKIEARKAKMADKEEY